MEHQSKTISGFGEGLGESVGERSDAGQPVRQGNLIQIAQVETAGTNSGTAGGGLGVEQAQPGDFDPNTVTQTFAAIDGRAIVLPAETQISRILVSGADLVIIAADGSVYLIENGAQTPPTLVIDGLAIPASALAEAITGGTELLPAAGPDSGTGAPAAPGSSGNSFGNLEIGNLGDGVGFGGLLQGLELFFSGGVDDEPRDAPLIEPVVLGDDGIVPVSSVLLEEDDLLGVISAFGGFEGFDGFEGGAITQYSPDYVFAGVEGLFDTLHDFAYGTDFEFHDLFYPGTVGNLGGIVLFNYDFSFLEKFGGLGNDEDASRLTGPDGLSATGNFNVGFVDAATTNTIVFDPSLAGDSGLTSNGQTVLFQISTDEKTLFAYTESVGKDVPVRPIFEISIDDETPGGTYSVELFNNLDHLPTVQGEEILPFNFPFIATDGLTGATEASVFQVQFQDDEPVLISDVLEEFYNAFVVLVDDDTENDDLSGFDWGVETLFTGLQGIFGEGFVEELPFFGTPGDDLPTFDQVYAFAQYFLGLEHGTVDESLLDNLDRDVHLADFQIGIGGIDTADNIEGSQGTHAEYREGYFEFLEYLFEHDEGSSDYDLPENVKYERRPDHEIESDGPVTTYGLLGALFGADAGDARSITFSADTAPTAGGTQLKSKGEDISYTVNEDGTVLQAFASSGDEDEPRLVFEVELTDQIVGAFRFTLFDQIDHQLPEPIGEESREFTKSSGFFEGIPEELSALENGFVSGVTDDLATLEFLYDVTDSDGDTATGSFFVDVRDDEPHNDQSHGTMVADAAIVAHQADQQLTGRLFVGADESGSIAFDFTQNDLDSGEETLERDGDFPDGLPAIYNGRALAYALSNDDRTLTARYSDATNGAVLFTLVLNPSNLTYTLDLVLEAPEFPENAAPVENASSAKVYDVGLLDFSVAITGTDFDGDEFSELIAIKTQSSGGGLSGSEYNDSIVGFSNVNIPQNLSGNGGDDIIVGGDAAHNNLFGGADDDVLIAGDSTHNELDGGTGDDILIGGPGNDMLMGGSGKDTLVGGAGANELTGGADADVFLFSPDALDGIADQVLDYSLSDGDQVDLIALFDVSGGDVADFVQYDQGTGTLSVDADGSDAGAAEVVATFTNTPADIEVLFSDSSTPGADTMIV